MAFMFSVAQFKPVAILAVLQGQECLIAIYTCVNELKSSAEEQ
jgi:hypothetical protein